MKSGDIVKVVYHDPTWNGPYYNPIPVWDATTFDTKGFVEIGDVALTVSSEPARTTAVVIHPTLGYILIDKAYLEVVNESR